MNRIALSVTLIGINLMMCGCSDSTVALRKVAKETQKRNEARINQIVGKAKLEADEERLREEKNQIARAIAEKAAEDKTVTREKAERKASDREIEKLRIEKVESALVRDKARRKAEQEAVMKDADNARDFNVELEQRQMAHKKHLEKFEAEKVMFKKAKIVYLANQQEIEATKLLRLARNFDPNSQIARRRFDEIVKSFPDTQSAKDARTLLAGNYVAPREIPKAMPAPLPPIAPKLILPMAPKQVAVVYPVGLDNRVEQITAQINTLLDAQLATQRAANVRREAKRKEEEARMVEVRRAVAEREAEVQREIAGINAETSGAVAEAEAAVQREAIRRSEAWASVVSIIFFLCVIAVSLFVYLLPIVVAVLRGHPDTAGIALVVVFFGCTTIGWAIALIWSVKAFPRNSDGTARDY